MHLASIFINQSINQSINHFFTVKFDFLEKGTEDWCAGLKYANYLTARAVYERVIRAVA